MWAGADTSRVKARPHHQLLGLESPPRPRRLPDVWLGAGVVRIGLSRAEGQRGTPIQGRPTSHTRSRQSGAAEAQRVGKTAGGRRRHQIIRLAKRGWSCTWCTRARGGGARRAGWEQALRGKINARGACCGVGCYPRRKNAAKPSRTPSSPFRRRTRLGAGGRVGASVVLMNTLRRPRGRQQSVPLTPASNRTIMFRFEVFMRKQGRSRARPPP